MTWWQALPSLVGTAALLLLPGALILRTAGVRGLPMWAFAGPTTVSVAGVAAVLGGLIGLNWTVWVLLNCSIALALVALLIRFALALSKTPSNGGPRFVRMPGRIFAAALPEKVRVLSAAIYTLAAAIPAAIIAVRFARAFGAPDAISQTFDNIYHLNAVRYILDTGDGSSLTLGNLTEASSGFYPAAWHNIVSVVLQLTGTSVPEAINLTNIAIASLFWPLALIFLVTRIMGNRMLPVLITGAIAAGSSVFPYLMVDYGVLYPNLLSIAILPAALGASIQILGFAHAGTHVSPVLGIGLMIAALPGLALSHPSTVLALIAFTAPVVLARLYTAYRESRVRPRTHDARKYFRIWLILTGAYSVAGLVAWWVFRPAASSSTWPPRQSAGQAIGEVLTSSPMGLTPAWIIFAFTVVGIYILVRERSRIWVLGIFLAGLFLFMMVSSWAPGDFRSFWTGIWYNDSNRLAALLPTVTLPIAVIGAERLIRQATAGLSKLRMSAGNYAAGLEAPLRAATAAVLVLLVAFLTQGGSMGLAQDKLDTRYGYGPSSLLISADEYELLERLPSHVPEGEAVLGNPWTGASLVYALADRETITPHIFGERTADAELVIEHWEDAAYQQRVCPAIQRLEVYWALDFGDLEVHRASHPLPGLSHPSISRGVELVDREGDAKLYRMTACE